MDGMNHQIITISAKTSNSYGFELREVGLAGLTVRTDEAHQMLLGPGVGGVVNFGNFSARL